MDCKICEQKSKLNFEAKILKKYNVKYYHCDNCGFLQTEEPFWLEESYADSINISDTGIMSRNLMLSHVSAVVIFLFFNRNKQFLDFAGGYGIFTRLMRDIGFDFHWNDKYSKNLVSRGFELVGNKTYELLTSFESFEHFDQPKQEIERMLKLSKNILFSTDLMPDNISVPDKNWWYYGFDHGQHISFYSLNTLQYLSKKHGLNLYTNGSSFHLLTEKKLNSTYFFLLLKLNRFGLFHLVRKIMKSKTLDDWNYLRSCR